MMPLRRAHLGDVVNDGALVDFSGGDRWWVGLYAGDFANKSEHAYLTCIISHFVSILTFRRSVGVPGHAFHIWNGETEELVFIGGTLTDPEAVMGWHLLTELTDLIGRVRVTGHGDTAVACTSLRVVAFDLQNQGVIMEEEEFRRGVIVGSFDAFNGSVMITNVRGVATVRRVANLEEVCRFTVRGGSQGETRGCVNGGYGVMWGGGLIRVWEIESGQYLYSFREVIGLCNALIADQRYVAACSCDGSIHLWDFGAQ